MYTAQVNYLNYVENKRHNLAMEQETNRTNVANEDIKRFANKETYRHNLATESVSQGTLDEGIRHNLASEGLGLGNLNEVIRNNMFTNVESQRHNMAGEANVAESNRIAGINATTNQWNAQSNRINANASATNADTNRLNYLQNRDYQTNYLGLQNQQYELDVDKHNFNKTKYAVDTTLNTIGGIFNGIISAGNMVANLARVK